ncbi:hypothetical protein MEO40_06975 [Dolichospermum sp. ST_sed1]|nr:hypothetical protein [Dolichospermum sp. ST_sed1]
MSKKLNFCAVILLFIIQAYSTNALANREPDIEKIDSIEGYVNDMVRFQVKATDDDNDPISFEAIGLPVGAVIDEQSGLVQWIPKADQLGVHPIIIFAKDNTSRSYMTVEISIVEYRYNFLSSGVLQTTAINKIQCTGDSSLILGCNMTGVNPGYARIRCQTQYKYENRSYTGTIEGIIEPDGYFSAHEQYRVLNHTRYSKVTVYGSVKRTNENQILIKIEDIVYGLYVQSLQCNQGQLSIMN